MDTLNSGVGVEDVEYSQDSGAARIQFDREKTPASRAVIATLADVLDTDPVELRPLHATVDPDALDALVRFRNGTTGDTHVTFTHEGHEIRVDSYGVITVVPPDRGPWAENEEGGQGQ